MKLKKEDAIKVMKVIKDPELNIDIWTLGLIYDVNLKEGNNIDIKMTFTSPMCPFGPQIVNELKSRLKQVGFNEPNINVVFEPQWQPSQEVRDILGV